MIEACLSLNNNASSYFANESYCPAYFDRIACWPPTQAGIHQHISCPRTFFPEADDDAYATRFCTDESRWEERGHYEFCIGCSNSDSDNSSSIFSLPDTYVAVRRYFVIGANGLSIILLALGILILLGIRRLRQYPRNILHANVFFVFLLRSIIQLIAEVFMSKGYFTHNVFERMDACNRTTVYFQEGNLLDCKLFTIFMNYINSSVAHWFVFCEAVYLFRLLRGTNTKDQVQIYIFIGWGIPLTLTSITYGIRIITKQDLQSCWFEPSIFDWILHGPNILLQIANFLIFNYVCVLLARKLDEDYRSAMFADQRRFAKYSRLARSTLILLPLFSIHYFFFLWNTKPLLIPHLILIHLTVHTISSSLQGFMVAMIYTFLNGEVQRELFRSIDRWLMGRYATWQPPRYLRDYIHKLDNEHFHSWPYSIPSSSRVNSLRSSNDHRIYQHIHQTRNSFDQCQMSMNEISNRT